MKDINIIRDESTFKKVSFGLYAIILLAGCVTFVFAGILTYFCICSIPILGLSIYFNYIKKESLTFKKDLIISPTKNIHIDQIKRIDLLKHAVVLYLRNGRRFGVSFVSEEMMTNLKDYLRRQDQDLKSLVRPKKFMK